METGTLIGTAWFVVSLQMTVFMWMWVFAPDKQRTLAQLYIGSWKKIGSAVCGLAAPFFQKSK